MLLSNAYNDADKTIGLEELYHDFWMNVIYVTFKKSPMIILLT